MKNIQLNNPTNTQLNPSQKESGQAFERIVENATGTSPFSSQFVDLKINNNYHQRDFEKLMKQMLKEHGYSQEF